MEPKTADPSASADESLDLLIAGLKNPPEQDDHRYRDALAGASASLEVRFRAGESVVELVHIRSRMIDHLLLQLWRQFAKEARAAAALIAVGGYGRGELHPYSDIDIMVLVSDDVSAIIKKEIGHFLTSLWDLGLEIGHSVRTVDDCISLATGDITIATTLMEARLLDGDAALFTRMETSVSPDQIWSSERFFAEKLLEQKVRHHRYDDTAYKLEPNVKGSPGGLRDIQMIGWVAKRHFGGRTMDELVAHEFLTSGQLKKLNSCQEFLWRVRFGLHMLTGRREDRLLFDHQVRLAELLGYEDATHTLAVEQLMQRYYRTVMELSRLNEMLLQQFEEAILMDPEAASHPINARFQLKNGYLQTTNDDVFQHQPSALLELFLLLQQHDDIRGVSAYTIRLIRRNLHLIDEEFRQNPRNHRFFMAILKAPTGVTHELRRMNLYGVLGLYIPSFGRIVGRMQYDLFHAYTVDQHTLFVVSNLRRFALSRFDHEYPHCSPLMQSFEKPEIVYLAGLFHDIAKGRGGDHSELGAVDAEEFCLEHGMSQYDARTVAWLVRHHLVLSMTAQKKDISDPDAINDFAAMVGDQAHLDYLYILTVADVKGTNPQLWNSWKATLFFDLYELTSRVFRRGLENPIDRELLIDETQSAARSLLAESKLGGTEVDSVWRLFTEDYFLRYRPGEIAWHTAMIVNADNESTLGVLDIRRQPDGDGIEAMLYSPRSQSTFAQTTALLAELGMTIVDVRIVPLTSEFSLDTYIFMELDKKTETDEARLTKVRRVLTQVLTVDSGKTRVTRPAPRQVRMFSTKTSVTFSQDNTNRRTVIELVAGDRPGLLSTVGRLFVDLNVNIETAKILTIGERAEDVFYVVDKNNEPLEGSTCVLLRDKLMASIDADT